jgi:hypothetical protein
MSDSRRRRRLAPLPPGLFAGVLTAALVVGVLTAGGFLPAGVALGLYLVLGGRYGRAPHAEVYLWAGFLAVVCVLVAAARGQLNWAIAFLAVAVACAAGAVTVHAWGDDDPPKRPCDVPSDRGSVGHVKRNQR